MQKKHSSGFTLVELMIVVAITAILVAIAIPSYYAYVMKSRRADAKVALSEISQRLEGYYADNNKYATDFDKLKLANSGFVKKGGTFQSKDGWYQLQIEVDTAGQKYTLKAVPQGAQASDGRCGTLILDNTGKKTISGSAPVKECW
jgi:type IV pilus assembly protein PilE